MQVLLIGEYSRLHQTLKEGLETLGHQVVLMADGDGFKNYPADWSTAPKICRLPILRTLKNGLHKLFGFDAEKLEKGIRTWMFLRKSPVFDVVQFINEKPFKTFDAWELYFLKRFFSNHNNLYLLSSGIDVISLRAMQKGVFRYSQMDPLRENPGLKNKYAYILDYLNSSHLKTHAWMMQHVKGIIASDMDYVLPLQNHPKFLGLIPNPIHWQRFGETDYSGKVHIFLGINGWTCDAKGIRFFEEAMQKILEKYGDNIRYTVAENLPYAEYINVYTSCHILLDQVYAYDQGYNALEAMAQGKVVFTGAELEFAAHYGIEINSVAVNALPDVNYLVEKLSELIENRDTLARIGKNAKAFIIKEHDFVKIAKDYVGVWTKES